MENFIWFFIGYAIKKMTDDGSCLFRAIGDQVFGDQEMHGVVRSQCMNYIEQNADYFSHYITEDIESYVSRKRYHGVHGNHLEIQAMSEMYSRPIHIYCYSLEPINIFQTCNKSEKVNVPVRLSYHRGVHYNSIVDPYKATIGIGLGKYTSFIINMTNSNFMAFVLI
jgi:OTU domain-containing protein 5